MAGRNDAAIATALEAMAHAMDTLTRMLDLKFRYGTHMLAIEVDDWWLETRQRLENAGKEITWVVFHREFMRKYYPEDVQGKKEIEFLELKQGKKSVTEYVVESVELAKFYPHYSEATTEFSKYIKFKNGLRSEIKKTPYDAPAGKGKLKVADGKRASRGYARADVTGHAISECKHKKMVCFNYSEEGHIGSQYHKSKQAQAGGKVFALAGTQKANEDRIIRGTCFSNSTPLITIIDIGATHCFTSADCVEILGLMLSSMNREKVVDTPAKGSVTTFLVCLKCPLSIFDRDFVVDLVCLPLSGLDVILGTNWLEYNHVHINCYDKSVRFSTPKEEGVDLLSAK
ncbi:uncharacterized protein LOC131613399 [Vicia villosa]|uniref:uncharacterized protein LOC131613399 n=1 Tax=Vicia villosa TaxID=3911 RepID=UPI00273BAD1C|nr:uncharacterized protein LOC131613399 [Vicia villosa]